MSVWKSVQNQTMNSNVEMDLLETALKGMGVELDYTVNQISNHWGHEQCTAAFVKDGKILSLGINVTSDGGVELVGDTYATGLGGDGKQEALMNRISQLYNSELYQDRLASMGYNIDSVEVNEEGKIVITSSCF